MLLSAVGDSHYEEILGSRIACCITQLDTFSLMLELSSRTQRETNLSLSNRILSSVVESLFHSRLSVHIKGNANAGCAGTCQLRIISKSGRLWPPARAQAPHIQPYGA